MLLPCLWLTYEIWFALLIKLNKCDSLVIHWINARRANPASNVPAGVHSNRRNNLHVFTGASACWLANVFAPRYWVMFACQNQEWCGIFLFWFCHQASWDNRTSLAFYGGELWREMMNFTRGSSSALSEQTGIEVHGYILMSHLYLNKIKGFIPCKIKRRPPWGWLIVFPLSRHLLKVRNTIFPLARTMISPHVFLFYLFNWKCNNINFNTKTKQEQMMMNERQQREESVL